MAQLTAQEWNLVQSALPLAKSQRSKAQIAAMQKYRGAGRPDVPAAYLQAPKQAFGVGAADYAAAHNLNPNTGLPWGVQPNVALAGTYAGQRLPRGGKDLNPKQIKALRGKQNLLRLTQSLMQSPDPDALTAFGAEEGIYGRGGYKKWLKQWNKAFTDLGQTPISPDQWMKMIGYDPYQTPGAHPTEKDKAAWRASTDALIRGMKKKGFGRNQISWMAGSGPFDESMRTPESQVLAFNTAMGTNYKTIDEAMSGIAPVAGWAWAQYNNLPYEERVNPSKRTQALLAISRLGPHYGKEDTAHTNVGGDLPQINYLTSILAKGGKAAKRELRTILKQLDVVKGEMPSWLGDVYTSLAGSEAAKKYGVDRVFFDALDALSGPTQNINLTDPNQPLFNPATNPVSSAMHGMGGGDILNRFLASLSAPEYMKDVAPLMLQYEKDPEFRAKYADMTWGGANPNNPFAGLSEWKRYRAYGGMAGGSLDAQGRFQAGTGGQGFITRRALGMNAARDPFLNTPLARFVPKVETTAWPNINLHNISSPQDWAMQFAGLPTQENLGMWQVMHGGAMPDFTYVGVPGYQNMWNTSALAGQAPWQMDPATLNRLMTSLFMPTNYGV